MRVLSRHLPTPEQIGIITRIRAGVTIIRGAAGSGKTTTALLSLRASTEATINQLRAVGALPARVLVLTYNNSLRGYIAEVADDELAGYGDDLDLTVTTFDKWAYDWTGMHNISLVHTGPRLAQLAYPFPRDTTFIKDETDYVLGRFLPQNLGAYTTAARAGRGASPQMDQAIRERLLNEVIGPYLAFKADNGFVDFHDLAVAMISVEMPKYDVVVVDEAQDLSANQLRAIMAHVADGGIVTFVTDTAQRIYPRGTTWAECGIDASRTTILNTNYRNTTEIASLSAALAAGLPADPDSTPPDPARCVSNGPLPIVVKGLFGSQMDYALARLQGIDLEQETVAFLHLKGGGWFKEVRARLAQGGHDFCELQGVRDWPIDDANIGLSTIHSAKGLEFDHVFLLGLSQDHAAHGEGDEDEQLINMKRMLAMAVGRARRTVTLGMKPGEEVDVFAAVDPALYELRQLDSQ